MKKYLLFLPIILLVPSISACQDTEHSVVAINNLDHEPVFIELSKQQLKNLIDNKQNFLLEFYSPYCGHCVDLAELLTKYVNETDKTIYRFDLSTIETDEFITWNNEYPDIFVNQYVPSLRFIKNGKLTYEVSSEKHESYRALRSILNNHFISSDIYISSDLRTVNEFENEYEESVIYAYDLDNPTSVKIASENIITKSFAVKYDVLLLNKTQMGSEFKILKQHYNVDFDTFIIKIENEKWTALDYSTSSFNFADLF